MINKNRLVSSFCELVSIDTISLKEEKMIDFLTQRLQRLGIQPQCDRYGNIYAFVKGSLGGGALLLSAHTDTVQPGINKKPVIHDDGKITSDGTTVLGADDMSGVAAILETLEVLHENRLAHRDIELLFPAAEEIYAKGSKAFDYSLIKSKIAYVIDLDGSIGRAAVAAPSLISFEIEVIGKSAHAGFAPENGINAIAAAAEATAAVRQGRPDNISTLNIGCIKGGSATNIVSDICTVGGELRSLNHDNALKLFEDVKHKFELACLKHGAQCNVKFNTDLTAYNTPSDSETVRLYTAACRNAGIEPQFVTTFGGSDNNNFAQHGIEGIVISAGYHNAHTCSEYIYINDLEKLTGIILDLVR